MRLALDILVEEVVQRMDAKAVGQLAVTCKHLSRTVYGGVRAAKSSHYKKARDVVLQQMTRLEEIDVDIPTHGFRNVQNFFKQQTRLRVVRMVPAAGWALRLLGYSGHITFTELHVEGISPHHHPKKKDRDLRLPGCMVLAPLAPFLRRLTLRPMHRYTGFPLHMLGVLTNLEELELGYTGEPLVTRSLAPLAHSLRLLVLECNAEGEWPVQLRALAGSTTLRTLVLKSYNNYGGSPYGGYGRRAQWTDTGLAGLALLTSLTDLSLVECGLKDGGLQNGGIFLEPHLRPLAALEHLSLRNVGYSLYLSWPDVAALSSLRHLALLGTPPIGVLLEVARLTRLTRVDLSYAHAHNVVDVDALKARGCVVNWDYVH